MFRRMGTRLAPTGFFRIEAQEFDMDENRFEGTARNVGGAIKGAVGDLTGDQKLQAEGAADKLAGKAQRTYGQAADAVRDTVRDVRDSAGDYGSQVLDQIEEYGDALAEQVDARPITAVLIAAGIGFLLALATKPAPRVVYRRR